VKHWITWSASGSPKNQWKRAMSWTSNIACTGAPASGALAAGNVFATRTGMGGFPEGWAPGENYPKVWARRFAIDFVGGDLKAAAPKALNL
jgi:glucan biosynthesis protein